MEENTHIFVSINDNCAVNIRKRISRKMLLIIENEKKTTVFKWKSSLCLWEKGKENNKEKKFILVRHVQAPNSISTSFLHNFSVIVTFVIKIVPEYTCLITLSII